MSETPQSASQAFFSGCKSGLNLALYGILPRVMVAFIFISVLEACGAMSLIGDIFTPLMHVWSLPGEAAVVLATAILSNAAAVGTIVSLFASGTLSAADATILMPGYISWELCFNLPPGFWEPPASPEKFGLPCSGFVS